jgi:DNA polymerase III subunit delta
VYLLSGSDRPKIEHALGRLRARIGADGVEIVSARDLSGTEVVALCNAPVLFVVEARAVIVLEVEQWKAADTKAVVEYLENPAPSTVLVLVGSDLKADSALAKACGKVGTVLIYDVEKKKLPAWVAQRFRDLGTEADRDACILLVELVGDDVTELNTEITKLATWAAGATIDTAAVEAVAAGRAEIPAFALSDAWGARDAGAALAASEAMLERSGKSRAAEVARAAARLIAHVQFARRTLQLANAEVPTAEIAKRLKRNPYYVKRVVAQAQAIGAEEIEDALVRLSELDLALKGGSRLPPELELDRAVVDAARGRPARDQAKAGG